MLNIKMTTIGELTLDTLINLGGQIFANLVINLRRWRLTKPKYRIKANRLRPCS